MNLNFDTQRFRRACRGVKLTELAPVIGIKHPNNLSTKLKKTEKISVEDFLKICEYLDEDPNRFIISG